MEKGIKKTVSRRKPIKNATIKVTRVFLAEYMLVDKLYSLVIRQLTSNKT